MLLQSLKVIVQFFNQDGWSYQQESENVLSTAVVGKHGRWSMKITVRPHQGLVRVYSLAPVDIPYERFTVVAEYLHRANYGIYVSSFEMNYATGQVQCRTGIDITDMELTTLMVKHLVYNNIVMMDKYLPGLEAVVSSELTSVEAIERTESGP